MNVVAEGRQLRPVKRTANYGEYCAPAGGLWPRWNRIICPATIPDIDRIISAETFRYLWLR